MRKTILIIEDEKDLVSMIKFQLEVHGYDVVCANNGIEGLAKLGQIHPDAILLDLNMPKVGGVEFCHRIKNPDGTLKYSVVVITARANTEEMMKEFKISGFLSKPFTIDQLLKQLSEILQKKN